MLAVAVELIRGLGANSVMLARIRIAPIEHLAGVHDNGSFILLRLPVGR